MCSPTTRGVAGRPLASLLAFFLPLTFTIMLQETYKLANLPQGPGSSRLMLNVLQTFMERLGLPEDMDESSLEIQVQLSNNLAIEPTADLPEIGPQSTVSQFPGPWGPQNPDSAESMQLARAMTAKIQRHMIIYMRLTEFLSSRFGLIIAQEGTSELRL